MKNAFLLFVLLWFSSGVNAHGFDYSVIVLTEKENNTWNLHLTSSLDAFRKEVKIHFADTPYTTPEEFNEQLLKHISSTLQIKVKGESISLGDGKVTLGHETSIAFKQFQIPNTAKAVQLINGAVKDIYRHTTKLFVHRLGKDKKSYILNKANDFTAEI